MHGSTMGGKIHQAPIVAAMDLPRSPAAFRASCLQTDGVGDDQEPVGLCGHGIDHQTSRRDGETAWNGVQRISSSLRIVRPRAYPPCTESESEHRFGAD